MSDLRRVKASSAGLSAVQRLFGNKAATEVIQRQKAGKKPPPYKTTFNLTNSSYSLTGPTLDDVESEMSGREEAGYVGWNPTFSSSEYDGRVTKVEVKVDIDLEMPSWTPPKTMTAKGKAEWTRWYGALRAHEQGHIDLIKQKMSGVAARMIGKTPADAQVIFDEAVAALKKLATPTTRRPTTASRRGLSSTSTPTTDLADRRKKRPKSLMFWLHRGGPPGTIEHMFSGVIAELRGMARSLDPALVSPHDAVRLLDQVAQIEKLTAGLKVLLAARAAASGSWRRDGARDEADWLARKTGTTKARAVETLRASAHVGELPAVAAALREGRLSGEQAATVADAAIADPSAEGQLVRLAQRESVARLRAERDRVKAAACPDPEERHRRIHAGRYLRLGTDAEGAGIGSWRVTPEIQAELRSRLAPLMRRVFEEARDQGRREPAEAYAADALVELARAAGAGGAPRPEGANPRHTVPAKVIVRIDWEALVRGRTESGETCDIGGMPVPVSVVADLVSSANPFLTAVLTRGTDIARVVHLGRGPSALQRTALEWRHTGCARLGCSMAAEEYDHREPYAKVKVTTLDNLVGLCRFDHSLKTHRGFRMVETDVAGKIDLVPPEEPGDAEVLGDTTVSRDTVLRDTTVSRDTVLEDTVFRDTG